MRLKVISIILVCCTIIISFFPVFTGEYRGYNMVPTETKNIEIDVPPENKTGSLYNCIGARPYIYMIIIIVFLLLSTKKTIFTFFALLMSAVNAFGLWIYGSGLLEPIITDVRYWVMYFSLYGKIMFGLSAAVVICILIDLICSLIRKTGV